MTIFWCADAANAAAQHLQVMQAAFQNYGAIKAKIGRSASGRSILEAMLTVDGVPSATKMLAKKLLGTPQVPMTNACRNLLEQVENNIPKDPETPQQLAAYFQTKSQDSKVCPGFHTAVQAAVEIVMGGNSTIYNRAWIAKASNGEARGLSWKKIVIADAIGALGGCLGGVGGMVVGAAVASLDEAFLK